MSESILTKVCSKCQVSKPISEFSKNKKSKDGLQCHCKQCVNAYNREYGLLHKAEKAEYDRIYIKSYKRDRKEYYLKRYYDNKPKYAKSMHKSYIKHKTKRLIYAKEYMQTEAGKNNSKKASHKRNALKRNAKIEDFSPLEVFERDKYICQLCGCKTSLKYKNRSHPKRTELDHIIPLSLGGEHSRRNTQCLCRKCNMKKSNTGKGDQLRLF